MTRKATWKDFNLLARCYLDFQHTAVAVEHRIRLMLEDVLMALGLMIEIKTTRVNSKGVEKHNYKRELVKKDKPHKPVKPEEGKDHNYETKKKIYEDQLKDYEFELQEVEEFNKGIIDKADRVEEDLEENNEAYKMAGIISKSARKDEKQMLLQCKELFKESALWEWCLRVRGLGPVAAMTFIAYINPDKVKRVESVWRYFGLTPDSKLIPGQKASFNLEVKGRMYVIKNNIIMQNDEYYAELYRMKKDYYMQIDEVLEKRDKMAGWRGWVDSMAKMAVIKIVVSHATEIILKSNNKPFLSEHKNNRYLPPKPDNPVLVKQYLDYWRADMPEKVRIRNNRYKQEKIDAEKEGITVPVLRAKRALQWKENKSEQVRRLME